MNPVTHLHEIIAVSGLIHKKVNCDGDTKLDDPAATGVFAFVRQLGNSCGPQFPSLFPHDLKEELKKTNGKIKAFTSERELLSCFLACVQQNDPDIFASHNLLGFEFEVLLARCVYQKLPNWHVLGRLRKTKIPKNISQKEIGDASVGRILCDTYKVCACVWCASVWGWGGVGCYYCC